MEIRSDHLAKDCCSHSEADWTARPAEDGVGHSIRSYFRTLVDSDLA